MFDSGRASATKPSRASRLVACATPKTSATYAVAICFLVSCKGQARSCLTHVCRSERADLLFVHHSERIGHARRRFVMLRYQAACIIGSACGIRAPKACGSASTGAVLLCVHV